LATMSHGTLDYIDADVDITYRMYCITVENSPSFKAVILFDTCAHLSAVTEIVSCDCVDIDIDMTYRM
jgi:hypothetical protein